MVVKCCKIRYISWINFLCCRQDVPNLKYSSPAALSSPPRNDSIATMKTTLSYLPFLAGVAQAGKNFTMGGLEFTMSMFKGGEEIDPPVPMPGNRTTAHGTLASVTSNWCGLSQINPPSGEWTNIYGRWFVPAISLRSGQTDASGDNLSQWVGLGSGCSNTIFQAGTDTYLDSNGNQGTYAWWEMFPAGSVAIGGFPVTPGDFIVGNLTKTSDSSGLYELINETQGYSIVIDLTDSGGNLVSGCLAEWILEAPASGGILPLPNFFDTAFWDGYTISSGGANYGPTFGTDIKYVHISSCLPLKLLSHLC